MSTFDEARHTRGRADIAAASLALLAEDGTGSLTMRAVANRLRVQASSLYTYVRDKDDLLQLVIERALGDAAPHRGGWDGCTREVVDRVALMIADNPRIAYAVQSAPGVALRTLRAQASEAMRNAPFDETVRNTAVDALTMLLFGIIAWHVDLEADCEPQTVAPRSDPRALCELLLAGIATATPHLSGLVATRPVPTAGTTPTRRSTSGKWHRVTNEQRSAS